MTNNFKNDFLTSEFKLKVLVIVLALILVAIIGFKVLENDSKYSKKSFVSESSVIKKEYNSDFQQNNNFEQPDKKSTSNVDFAPYMKKLQMDIKRNWNPPKNSDSLKTVVLFRVSKTGMLLEDKIIKSSGNVEYDEIALKTIYETAPFAKLPREFKGDYVDISFTFDYNVFNTK